MESEGRFVEVSRQRRGEQRKSDDKIWSLEKHTVREERSHRTEPSPLGFQSNSHQRPECLSSVLLPGGVLQPPSQPALLLGQLETDQKTLLVLSRGRCVDPLFTNLAVPQNCGEAWYMSRCPSLSRARNGGQNPWNQDVSQGRNPQLRGEWVVPSYTSSLQVRDLTFFVHQGLAQTS